MTDSTIDLDQVRRQTLLSRVSSAYDRVKTFPMDRPDGMAHYLELRSLMPDVILELERGLPAQETDSRQLGLNFRQGS